MVRRVFEGPTWFLVGVIYGGWLALTFWWHALPLWLVVPLGAWLCAWHMSLQHELIHGHPTRHEWLNAALGWPPLNLWLPYPIYRALHLRHHDDAHLTDPLEDPESTYMSAAAWARAGWGRRAVHGACNTLIGRLVLGPPWAMLRFWVGQIRLGRAGKWRVWLGHVLAVALVLGWVCGVCGIGAWVYVLCWVYPASALIMVRSLAEHRAAERPQDRTAVVERAGLLGLLFLYNNLHVLHHAEPGVAWFALPGRWRQVRLAVLAGGRGPVYRGYGEVAARYGWRPHHPGPHPGL